MMLREMRRSLLSAIAGCSCLIGDLVSAVGIEPTTFACDHLPSPYTPATSHL
jgi:hypothetical protein